MESALENKWRICNCIAMKHSGLVAYTLYLLYEWTLQTWVDNGDESINDLYGASIRTRPGKGLYGSLPQVYNERIQSHFCFCGEAWPGRRRIHDWLKINDWHGALCGEVWSSCQIPWFAHRAVTHTSGVRIKRVALTSSVLIRCADCRVWALGSTQRTRTSSQRLAPVWDARLASRTIISSSKNTVGTCGWMSWDGRGLWMLPWSQCQLPTPWMDSDAELKNSLEFLRLFFGIYFWKCQKLLFYLIFYTCHAKHFLVGEQVEGGSDSNSKQNVLVQYTPTFSQAHVYPFKSPIGGLS